jgi:hypothetical protein
LYFLIKTRGEVAWLQCTIDACSEVSLSAYSVILCIAFISYVSSQLGLASEDFCFEGLSTASLKLPAGYMHGKGRTFFGEAPVPAQHFDTDDSFPEATPDAQRRVGYAMGRLAAEELLKPLVAALCTRLKQILTRLPSLALAEFEELSGGFGRSGTTAPPQKLAQNFVKALESKTIQLVTSAQVATTFSFSIYLSRRFKYSNTLFAGA